MEKRGVGLGMINSKNSDIFQLANAALNIARVNLSDRRHLDVTPDTDEKVAAMIERRKRILSNVPR